MTIVRNKQYSYNSRSAARGKFRLVENRFKTDSYPIDLLAILEKSLDRALLLYILYTRFDRMALELLSPSCTFENSTNCSKISFDSDSLQNS